MTISELYERLCKKDFRDPATGSLFFPVYIYLYNPEDEYKIRDEIKKLSGRLERPTDFIDAMLLDIFDEFLEYLKANKFGKQSLYDFFLEEEGKNHPQINDLLRKEANSDVFMKWLYQKISSHLNLPSKLDKVYVFVHGVGKMYPWLRVSRFLNRFEKFIQGYKMIIFYPGTAKDNFSLFGLLEDEHAYRSIKLITDTTFN